MGPIISRKQLEMIEGYVQIGQSEGAQVAVGGGTARRSGSRAGVLLPADAARRVTADMRVAQEENLRAGAGDHHVRRRRGGDRDGESQPDGLGRRRCGTRDINKAMSLASRIKAGQVTSILMAQAAASSCRSAGTRRAGTDAKRTGIVGELHPGEERLHQVHLTRDIASHKYGLGRCTTGGSTMSGSGWSTNRQTWSCAFRARSRSRQASPKAWADAYLAAFAEASQLTLVTFDRAFSGPNQAHHVAGE
jgi:hypothetical protein